jgi:hypothetical protein
MEGRFSVWEGRVSFIEGSISVWEGRVSIREASISVSDGRFRVINRRISVLKGKVREGELGSVSWKIRSGRGSEDQFPRSKGQGREGRISVREGRVSVRSGRGRKGKGMVM